MVSERGYSSTDETRTAMQLFVTRMYTMRDGQHYFPLDEHGKSTYRNAGEVRNLVEKMAREQATRLGGQVSDELTMKALPTEFRKFLPAVRPDQVDQEGLNSLLTELEKLIGL